MSWLAVLALWAVAASVYVSPAVYGKYIAVVGLTFPFCAAAVGAMGVLCLLIKPRLAWIAVVGLLGCMGTVRDYFPINLTSPPPKQAFKVMSYNTLNMGNFLMDDNGRDFAVMRYVCSQQPTIACLQEFGARSNEELEKVKGTARRYGLHLEVAQVGTSRVAVLSKWPIARKEVICHSVGNGAAAFYVVPRHADTIIVVNAHLESMHLELKERANFSKMVHNLEAADTIRGKFTIIRKIAHGGAIRACQADTLAQFIEHNRNRKLILMGDFNDTPVSYAHHTVCSRLTDCYRATANGLGRSFNRNAMYVRIDHLFCSSHFKPYAVSVDQGVPFSDHYPLVGYLKEEGH